MPIGRRPQPTTEFGRNPARHANILGMKHFRSVMRWMTRLYRRTVSRVQQRGSNALLRAFRLTGAAVAAYIVAGLFLQDTVPVIAALTALLVVEVTLFDIVTSGVQRVVSVVVGVLLAVGFSSLVGISWWSLGLLMAVSILVGQLLRLGPHLVEVPISAMLVLAVGGEETVASDRIIETLIGAAVGVAVNIIFPPRIRADTAARAVGNFADEIASLLQNAADELLDGITPEEADHWLEGGAGSAGTYPESIGPSHKPNRAVGSTLVPWLNVTPPPYSEAASSLWNTPQSRCAACSVPSPTASASTPSPTATSRKRCDRHSLRCWANSPMRCAPTATWSGPRSPTAPRQPRARPPWHSTRSERPVPGSSS